VALTAGARLGPYEIVATIGRGGMGDVFEARDTRLHRRVAIKILPRSLAHEPEHRERFEREARAIAALSHPNICMLHDVGRQNEIDFLVMEYLDGETLSTRLARQPFKYATAASSTGARSSSERFKTERAVVRAPLPIEETLRIATQLADAVAAAHRAGIVHRDLKPGNVMLTKTGVKVLDFGLAKAVTASGVRAGESGAQAVTTSSDPLTARGTILGTLPYMAPEQVEGREADTRSDIFAFGAIVYEMATGRRAFTGDSPVSLIAAILERNPSPISDEHTLTPPALERLV
jgi:serine/threonine protein kinase